MRFSGGMVLVSIPAFLLGSWNTAQCLLIHSLRICFLQSSSPHAVPKAQSLHWVEHATRRLQKGMVSSSKSSEWTKKNCFNKPPSYIYPLIHDSLFSCDNGSTGSHMVWSTSLADFSASSPWFWRDMEQCVFDQGDQWTFNENFEGCLLVDNLERATYNQWFDSMWDPSLLKKFEKWYDIASFRRWEQSLLGNIDLDRLNVFQHHLIGFWNVNSLLPRKQLFHSIFFTLLLSQIPREPIYIQRQTQRIVFLFLFLFSAWKKQLHSKHFVEVWHFQV